MNELKPPMKGSRFDVNLNSQFIQMKKDTIRPAGLRGAEKGARVW